MTDRNELMNRMCRKADHDSRAYWVARALGCSRDTTRALDTMARRSHLAWERAARGRRDAR